MGCIRLSLKQEKTLYIVGWWLDIVSSALAIADTSDDSQSDEFGNTITGDTRPKYIEYANAGAIGTIILALIIYLVAVNGFKGQDDNDGREEKDKTCWVCFGSRKEEPYQFRLLSKVYVADAVLVEIPQLVVGIMIVVWKSSTIGVIIIVINIPLILRLLMVHTGRVSSNVNELRSVVKLSCDGCGKVHDMRFCPDCGRQRDQLNTICSCGHPIAGSFCGNCGTNNSVVFSKM
jgi:hypothetical protein